MKSWLCILSFLFCCTVYAQQDTFRAHVVDDETGESLPYVSVAIGGKNVTVSNPDGDFSVTASPKDSITVRYVGFTPQRFLVSKLPRTIRLRPMENTLGEVTVMPVEAIIQNVRKRLEKDFKKGRKRKADYFFRLTNTFGEKTELVEAFIEANSVSNLRDLNFLSGKRFRLKNGNMQQSQFAYSNMQRVLELGPMLNDVPFWRNLISPLGMNDKTANRQLEKKDVDALLNFYDIGYEVLNTGDNQKGQAFRLNFERKSKKSTIMIGSLYVDAKTFRPLRMEAKMYNVTLAAILQLWKKRVPADISLHVNYTHEQGFTEVADISGTLIAGDMTCRALLFNIAGQDLPKPKRNKKKTDNMLANIDQAGYDSTLWNNEIIQRTRQEEKVYRVATGLESEEDNFEGPFLTVMERLSKFGKTIPQEKIYIHMDNTCYFQGDTIRFAAYTRQTNDGRPSKVSGVLYVELLNQDGYLVERKLIDISGGCGHGFFALNNPIQYSGFYELRAYTRWQLNWGVFEHKHSRLSKRWFFSKESEKTYYRDYEKLYSRVFPVYDKPKQNGIYERNMTNRTMARYFSSEPDQRKLTLNLFPEGGNLVEGVENRVAFEAAWNDGEWAEGTLYVNGDSAVTVHRGRGVFRIKPGSTLNGEKYERGVTFRTKDGKTIKEKLPRAEKSGVALSVQRKEHEWTIFAHPTDTLCLDSLALTIMHEGVLQAFHPLNEVEYGLRIDNSALPAGVNQVTVFDTRGRVYADRLFFVNRQDLGAPTLNISGLKDEYTPYEQIKLNIAATGKDMEGAQTSIAVYDQMDWLYDNGNILTEMLLGSEIRGFVPDPEWYFEKDDAEHRMALDLLMMTQGWRRFKWEDMAVRGKWDLTQPDERAPIVTGIVYKWLDWTEGTDDGIKTMNLIAGQEYEHWQRNTPGNGNQESESSKQEKETSPESSEIFRKKTDLKKEVAVHGEIVTMAGTQVSGVNSTDIMTRNGRFRIKLPKVYDKSILFLGAADLKKEEKNGKEYDWIRSINDVENISKQNSWDYWEDIPEYLVCVDWPYPRFVKPYNYYQERISEAPLEKIRNGKSLPNGIHVMQEVPVHAQRSGLRKFDYSMPAYIIDAYDMYNQITDAGMYLAGQSIEGRTLFGDLGFDDPFVMTPGGEKTDRISIDNAKQLPPGEMAKIPKDSIFSQKYLKIYSESDDVRATKELDPKDRSFYLEGLADKCLIYTDYCPRMEGSRQYWASDLPEIQVRVFPYPGGDKRIVYRDRRFILPGMAVPAEFYSPDYSKYKLPEGKKDYRRTLYWNPNVQLDENGEATITLYNNSHITNVSVEVNGQAKDGTLLTGKSE